MKRALLVLAAFTLSACATTAAERRAHEPMPALPDWTCYYPSCVYPYGPHHLRVWDHADRVKR